MQLRLEDINLIDLTFVILLVGMGYKGAKAGVGGQILSCIGWFALIFLPIRYYILLSEVVFSFLQDWAKPVSFLLITVAVLLIIGFVGRFFGGAKDEKSAFLEKLGGILVGSVRAVTLFGIIVMQLLLIPIDDVHRLITQDSKTGMYLVNLDAQIYGWIARVFDKTEKGYEKDEVMREFLGSVK